MEILRVLYKASLVVLLTDMFSKTPITDAVILCNGKQNPYVRKKDGYYVFSNLYPVKYEVSIKCKGYDDILINVEVKENETVVLKKQLNCATDNEALKNCESFEFTVFEDETLIPNKEVNIRLEEKLEFIKLTKPAEKGSNELYLNIPMSYDYMPQEYDYMFKRRAHNLYITGYDDKKKCFLLKDPLEKELEVDGLFKPVWRIKTDNQGKIALPLMEQYMKNDIINFSFRSEGKDSRVRVNKKSKKNIGNLYVSKVKLK